MNRTLALPIVPELPEVEAYRRLAETALDRTVASVQVGDERFVSGVTPDALGQALSGARFTTARRIGKLLVLETGDGPSLGLRFGMTGRLVVDGKMGVEDLVYASRRLEPAWERFAVTFTDGGSLAVSDARLLGSVTLDPDETRLGPDAMTLSPAELTRALGDSTAPLKARVMDQARIAGVGNLMADEILWRASLDPRRAAGSLSAAERRRLHRHIHATLADMMERGGSHTGDLMPERRSGGHCPRDGAELRRDTVGGRTTWWCPRHQH